MENVAFLSPNMPAAHVLCYVFFLYCKIEQIQGSCNRETWCGNAAKERMSHLAFCFSCWIISVSVPQGQKHILIPLSKLMIQTHGVTTQTGLVFSVETGQPE